MLYKSIINIRSYKLKFLNLKHQVHFRVVFVPKAPLNFVPRHAYNKQT